jgi:hypothetical protein
MGQKHRSSWVCCSASGGPGAFGFLRVSSVPPPGVRRRGRNYDPGYVERRWPGVLTSELRLGAAYGW